MTQEQSSSLSRRAFLWRYVAMPAALILAACTGRPLSEMRSGAATSQAPHGTALPDGTAVAQAPLAPTPVCGDDNDDDVTPPQGAGPFYTPNTPQRTSFLEPGINGTRMIVSGYVLTTGCQPVAGALLDWWHADDTGAYDNVGYKLRGHQYADNAGRFYLETIVPGLYPGRTRHFHVRVQGADQPVLTTQLYFPDEPFNARDGLYDPRLEMTIQDSPDGKIGTFNFVLDIA